MVTVPHYSRLGDRGVDQKVEKLERQTHINLPLEEIPHECSCCYHMLFLLKSKKKNKYSPLHKSKYKQDSNP